MRGVPSPAAEHCSIIRFQSVRGADRVGNACVDGFADRRIIKASVSWASPRAAVGRTSGTRPIAYPVSAPRARTAT